MKYLRNNFNLDTLIAVSFLIILAAHGPDKRWAGVYLATSLLLLGLFNLAQHSGIWIARLGKIYTLFICVGISGFYLTFQYPGHYFRHFVDWLCFIVIALVGMNISSLSRLYFVNKIVTIICLVYGLFQYYYHPEGFPASILLHQNITSQFLGASILIQIASGSFGLIGLSLAHIFILYCRSIWVALGVVFVLFLIRDGKHSFKKINAVIYQIGIAILAVIILTLSQGSVDPVSPMQSGITTSKGDSTSIRLTRWKNTLEMIKDNPLGVGPGNFEWGYTIYGKTDPEHQPRLNIRSPHNGYLELMVEWGIPAAILFIIGLLLLLKLIYPSVLASSVIILFMVDAFFAFPMELGFSFFITAFFVGYGLQKTAPSFRTGRNVMNLFLVVICLAIMPFALRVTAAEWWDSTSSYHGFIRSCELNPQNWQSCINAGVNHLKNKKYDLAEKTFKGILEKRPHMHPAIFLLAQTYKLQGRDELAEKTLRNYNTYFDAKKPMPDLPVKIGVGVSL